jgi:multidrug efflux pump
MPMAMGINIDILERKIHVGGPGGQWWAEMATVIIGGLTFASVLTLILTPSILMLQANVADWFRRRRAGRRPAATTVGATETAGH